MRVQRELLMSDCGLWPTLTGVHAWPKALLAANWRGVTNFRYWPTVACRAAVANGSSAAMNPVVTTVRFAAKRPSKRQARA
jgi:hypothetical protein